jgi:hypothetical protein
MENNEQKSADNAHREREEATLEATARISERAALRCWSPEEARAFDAWDR